MAKQSVINRNLKRIKTVELNYEKRSKLISLRNEAIKKIAEGVAKNEDTDQSEKDLRLYINKLEKMPKNSSRVRLRNRCHSCGRPRGYNSLTGHCRLCTRKLHALGYLPGVKKSSW